MPMRFVPWVLVATLGLSGCAVSSYCEGVQDYQKAESVPPLIAAQGLKLPESASGLKIPPPPAQPVAYAEPYKDADGDDRVRCLDTPPAMPPIAEPKAVEPAPASEPKA